MQTLNLPKTLVARRTDVLKKHLRDFAHISPVTRPSDVAGGEAIKRAALSVGPRAAPQTSASVRSVYSVLPIGAVNCWAPVEGDATTVTFSASA